VHGDDARCGRVTRRRGTDQPHVRGDDRRSRTSCTRTRSDQPHVRGDDDTNHTGFPCTRRSCVRKTIGNIHADPSTWVSLSLSTTANALSRCSIRACSIYVRETVANLGQVPKVACSHVSSNSQMRTIQLSWSRWRTLLPTRPPGYRRNRQQPEPIRLRRTDAVLESQPELGGVFDLQDPVKHRASEGHPLA
jgi:hypothetical protein